MTVEQWISIDTQLTLINLQRSNKNEYIYQESKPAEEKQKRIYLLRISCMLKILINEPLFALYHK